MEQTPMRRDPTLRRYELATDADTAQSIFIWCYNQKILCEISSKYAIVVCTEQQMTWILLNFTQKDQTNV